ncbi:MAG: TauD/TfdA family dioxygenase [Burkholderiaceae bacterium]
MKHFTVEPLDASFGARVSGLTLSTLSDDAFRALRQAWVEHSLLHVPAQFLTDAEQIAFAGRFGPLEIELARLSNMKKDGSVRDGSDTDDDVVKILKGNEGWHADSTYMPVQAMGAVFSAVQIPRDGAQTEFADMCAAYEALDPAMRERVSTLNAFHSLYYSQARVGHKVEKAGAGRDYGGYGFHDGPTPLRQLVKIHPETGRPALLIGRHAHAIPGLSDEASRQLLDELLAFACRPPRVYRHHWSVGDVIIWDNRCLLHRAVPYDMREPRVMWHSRIAGDPVTEAALEA